MKQKRLNRELIYQGKIIGVYQDTIELADGNVVKYDFIKHNGAAAVVPVTQEGKIIMVRQDRNAVNRETLEIPAGKRDGEEDPAECVKRELEEETGYRCGKLEHLITLDSWVAFCDEQIDVYVARELTPSKQHLDADEFIDVEEWEIERLEEMIFSGKIRDAKTIAGIMSYKAKYLSML